MIKIFHNPRCRKSREGLALLQDSGKDFKVINYLKDTPTKDELHTIIKLLNIAPIALIRKNETVWKENYRGKALSDEEVIEAMIEHPKLIERPIIINGNKAVVGRPTTLIEKVL